MTPEHTDILKEVVGDLHRLGEIIQKQQVTEPARAMLLDGLLIASSKVRYVLSEVNEHLTRQPNARP